MTTVNPYVCSDLASSNDLSVPYCDSEDDTEFHNGLGSDALMDEIHLEGPFQDEMRKLHKSKYESKHHNDEHFINWSRDNRSHIQTLRNAFAKKHREGQKSGHTAAGKKAHKDNKKEKKIHGKMSKFDSEFSKLYSNWKQMSHTLFHKAWVQSRIIIDMQESETKSILINEYMSNYGDSPCMVGYLKDHGIIFHDISEDEKFENLIENMKTLRTEIDNAVVVQKEVSAGKNRKSFRAITGGK